MARGFFGGVFWGAVVGIVGLVVVSQSVMPPIRPVAVQTPVPDETGAGAGVAAPEPLATSKETQPAPDAASEPVTTPPVAAAADPATPVADATPAPAPTEDAAKAEAEPAPAAVAPTEAVEPVAEPASDPAPAAVPALETAPAPEPAPAAEPAPAPEPASAAEPAPAADAAAPPPAPEETAAPAATEPVAVAPSDAPPSPVPTPETPATPAPPTVEAGLPGADSAPATAIVDPMPEAGSGETTPPNADPPPPPPLTPEEEALLAPAPTPEADTAPALISPDATPAPEAETAPLDPAPEANGATAEASTLTPDTGLPADGAGVRTDRLPRIGIETKPDEQVADTRPLTLFARPFENPTQKPMFSIVLVDTGGPDVDRTAYAALPFPVSFVIDPQAPDAKIAAEIYRAAGQEVLMLATGIPEGAVAADLEQTFQSNAAVLPEAVAVADLAENGFQENRPLAALVVPVVAAQGRGLLTYDKGLNAGDQVARREDLPSATIFRRLDAEGEDTPVIRRYLDRAAFKAAQEGRVVVQGTTRPETVQAILEWTVEGRAASVALAPVTAVLSTN